MQRILLASGNAKKLAELQSMCADLPVRIFSPADLPEGLPEVEEDLPDFEGNAVKKALSAAQAAVAQLGPGVWALADDSGLCVDALDGAPGVYSARYASLDDPTAAPGNAEDGANNRKLLRELQAVAPHVEDRGAAFHCVIAVAHVPTSQAADSTEQAEALFCVAGSVRGTILFEEDGAGGFGYDPLFHHVPSGCSFARLSAEEKRAVSHRGQAVALLRAVIEQRLGG
ncbi:MAG: non-canonical purine NTP pyrophosphatase [Planctomycetota bacterium]